MPLIAQQRVVYLSVKSEDYALMDQKIRQSLDVFPDCKIVSVNMNHHLWGAHVFVIVETV